MNAGESTVTEWWAVRVSPGRRSELDAMPRVSVTDVSPVTAIAAGFFIAGQSVSLDDQRGLTLLLGLGAPQAPRPAREPKPPATPDRYRRRTKGRAR